ncbi:hypothetical protein NQ315_016754 [Exocentrus adspersus]|uniref:Integrase catalytic domain-containing protein n=1 Tax=Exocentrus adspersus TaxID=1586481 RepID=A0AAV8VDI8_9CUCU|nr:hypothetical protein NQ315_016754 [Exocentrus adspersus]
MFGLPDRLISDRGKCFASKEMKYFCNKNGIRHVLNAVASPRSNGQVERFNSTILQALMTVIGDDHSSWESKITEVQLSSNGTVNATIGYAPSELLYGFRPKLKFDLSWSTHLDNNQQQVEQVDKVDRQTRLNTVRAKAAD